MAWEIVYYNEAVQNWVENLPVTIRAYYARITERIKTGKTPKRELATARRRLQEVKNENA